MHGHTAVDLQTSSNQETQPGATAPTTRQFAKPTDEACQAYQPCRGEGCDPAPVATTNTTTTVPDEPERSVSAPDTPAGGLLDLIESELVDEVVQGRLDLDFVDRTVVSRELMEPRPYWEAPARGATKVATAAERAAAISSTPERTVVALNPLMPHQASSSPDPATVSSAVQHGNRSEREPAAFRKPAAPPARPVSVPGRVEGGTAVSPAPASPQNGETVAGVPQYVADPRSPAPTTSTEPAIETGARFELIGAHLADDEDGRARMVRAGETFEIGSKPGSVFGDDPYIERYHASLIVGKRGVTVEDFGSKNGVFVRVQDRVPLREGTLIRVGQALLRLSPLCLPLQRKNESRPLGCHNPGFWARLDAMLTPEIIAASVPLQEQSATIGSGDTDMTFPEDPYIDPEHCTIRVENGTTMLVDHGSVWGTYVQAQTGDEIPYGSEVLIGSTRVRIQRA